MNKVTKLDPVTGPLSREQFAELVAAPFGEAVETIRNYDPQWGRAEGEKFAWIVKCRGELYGSAVVMAADRKEAEKLADDAEIDWCDGRDDFEILSVEPEKIRRLNQK